MNKTNCHILILLFGVLVILGCDGNTERHVKIEQPLPEGEVLINELQEDHDGFSAEDSYHNRFSFVPLEGGQKETVGESFCKNDNLDMNPEVTAAGKIHILMLKCFPGLRLFIRSEEGAWAQYPLDAKFFSNYPQWVKDQTPEDKRIGCGNSLLSIDRDKAEITIECSSVVKRRMTFRVVDGGKRLVMTALKRSPNPLYDVDSLKNQLTDKTGSRTSAAVSLGLLADPRPVDALIAALNDPNDRVSEAAAEVLGSVGDHKAVEPLISVLTNPEGNRAEKAAMALGRLKDPRAVEPLIKVLLNKSHGPLLFAIKVHLVTTTGREDYIRASAAEALGDIGDPRAIEPLAAVLQTSVSEQWYVRRAAATALGKIPDPRSVEALASCVNVYNEYVRSAVLDALRKVTGVNSGIDVKEKNRNKVPTDNVN